MSSSDYQHPKFGETISEEFIQKISFHMIQITVSPRRSIEYTEKLREDERSCEHIKRVCNQLIERINKFKPAAAEPEVKNLQLAAKWMKGMNFQDHYMRLAGTYLSHMIKEILDVPETSPDCSRNTL